MCINIIYGNIFDCLTIGPYVEYLDINSFTYFKEGNKLDFPHEENQDVIWKTQMWSKLQTVGAGCHKKGSNTLALQDLPMRYSEKKSSCIEVGSCIVPEPLHCTLSNWELVRTVSIVSSQAASQHNQIQSRNNFTRSGFRKVAKVQEGTSIMIQTVNYKI